LQSAPGANNRRYAAGLIFLHAKLINLFKNVFSALCRAVFVIFLWPDASQISEEKLSFSNHKHLVAYIHNPSAVFLPLYGVSRFSQGLNPRQIRHAGLSIRRAIHTTRP